MRGDGSIQTDARALSNGHGQEKDMSGIEREILDDRGEAGGYGGFEGMDTPRIRHITGYVLCPLLAPSTSFITAVTGELGAIPDQP